MPTSFPVKDPSTGHLSQRDYYSMAEVADMFHLTPSRIGQLVLRDNWPHLRIGSRRWFSEEDLLEALEHMQARAEVSGRTVSAPGIPVPPDPWLKDEEPADQDPGGVR